MAERNWTVPQRNAFESRGKTLLVSAAAGSGKTAVLTERIISRLCDDENPLDITDIAVVTFTKSAASELRERIAARLSAPITDPKKAKRMSLQLLKLQNANISTVDSFCYGLIKENFSLLGLPAGIKVGDRNECRVLAENAAQEVLNAYYAGSSDRFDMKEYDREAFFDLAEICSSAKSDDSLITLLVSTYSKIRNCPYPLKKYRAVSSRMKADNEHLKSHGEDFLKTAVGAPLARFVKTSLLNCRRCSDELLALVRSNSFFTEKYLAFFSDEALFYERMLALFEKCNYNEMFSLINSFEYGRKPAVRNCDDKDTNERICSLRAKAKDIISELKSTLFLKPICEITAENDHELRLQEVFLSMLEDFDRLYTSMKLERDMLDFGDVEHLALKLLCKNTDDFTEIDKTETAKRYTEKFSEIYIDEYQDTNEIQDAIFRAVSTETGRFMVGDPKQSIYAFRGAIPDIFINYKKNFPKFDKQAPQTNATIYLSNNFRSDSSVIDFTNEVFRKILNSNPENPLYLPEDELVCSKNTDKHKKTELMIFEAGKSDIESEDSIEKSYFEAYNIADRISDMVQNGEYDYKDIAVLSRSNNTLNTVREILGLYHIPFVAEKENDFFNTSEILFMLSLINAIDNPTRDMFLIGCMASPIFRFSSDELLEIRGFASDCRYFYALTQAAKSDAPISEKASAFLSKLEYYRDLSREMSADKLISRLYSLAGITDIFSTLGTSDDSSRTGEKRRQNLLSFYELARTYSSGANGSLSGFIEYLEAVKKEGISQTSGAVTRNAVVLQTVHGSKGLEYPCVFVCGLGDKFNMQDTKKSAIIDPDIGPAFYLTDASRSVKFEATMRQSAVRRIIEQNIEEEKRILYVAVTRAQEKLILSGTLRRGVSIASVLSSPAPGAADFSDCFSDLELLLNALTENGELCECAAQFSRDPYAGRYHAEGHRFEITFADGNSVLAKPEISEGNSKAEESREEGVSNDDAEQILKNVNFEYPDIELTALPKKLSVTELQELARNDRDMLYPKSLSDFVYASDSRKSNYAFIGTAMHSFMQFCSYDLCERDGVERAAELLLREEFISKAQFDCLDFEKLKKFFSTNLYRRLRASGNVHREFQFDILIPACDLLPTQRTENILLQGIIDCFFENSDGTLTVFDFKTDRTDNPQELIERHSGQMSLYRRALFEITGKSVSECYIYSFEIGDAVAIPI